MVAWTPDPECPLEILLDFDGTLVDPNVAIVLVEEFAENGGVVSREVDEELHSGKITLRQAWEREAALLSVDRIPEMTRFVREKIPLRGGALELLALLREHRVPTRIVSGGLDFYITPVLARESIELPVLADTAVPGPHGSLQVQHPYGHASCRLCGICKAQAVVSRRVGGRRSVFIGDGSTDRYAAEVADIVFARRRLVQICRTNRIPFYEFETFEPVTHQLGRWLTGAEPLPARRRVGLSGSNCPISNELAGAPVDGAAALG